MAGVPIKAVIAAFVGLFLAATGGPVAATSSASVYEGICRSRGHPCHTFGGLARAALP